VPAGIEYDAGASGYRQGQLRQRRNAGLYRSGHLSCRSFKDELPYKPTSGFQYKVLTDDPAVRKGADDILYDLFGEKNPRPL
jgi:hypothetical protein